MEEDTSSELEDNEVDYEDLNRSEDDDRMDNDFEIDFDEIFESVLNSSNDRDLDEIIQTDEDIIYGKADRPFTTTVPDYFYQRHRSIPINNNQGKANFDNLPENILNFQIKDVFKLFITEEIVDLIVNFTNIHSQQEGDSFMTNSEEVYNFIGQLVYQGFQKDSNLPVHQLYER